MSSRNRTFLDVASLRFDANLSQEELAAELGVSKRTVQNWEAGSIPRPSHRRRLLAYFGSNGDGAAEPEVAA